MYFSLYALFFALYRFFRTWPLVYPPKLKRRILSFLGPNMSVCFLCKFLLMCILTLSLGSFCWILVLFTLLLENWVFGFLIAYVILFFA